MEYSKPEVMLIGPATEVIEGEKAGKPDGGNGIGAMDCELED